MALRAHYRTLDKDGSERKAMAEILGANATNPTTDGDAGILSNSFLSQALDTRAKTQQNRKNDSPEECSNSLLP